MQLPYLWVCKKIKKTKQQQAVSTSHWNLLAIWCLLGVFPAIYAATVQENSRETFLLLIRCSRCTGEKEARESQEMWTHGLQALPLSPHLSSRSTTAQHTTISLIDQEITAILLFPLLPTLKREALLLLLHILFTVEFRERTSFTCTTDLTNKNKEKQSQKHLVSSS